MIITAYHTDKANAEMTQRCVDSLKYGRPDEVIIVDDASPFKADITNVDRTISHKTNKGYAGAVNSGLGAVSHNIIVVANNDIIFSPGWLEALVKPLTLGYDISSIRTSDGDGWDTLDEITDGDKFGSLWAMKREVYEKIGGYDEGLGKSSFEDTDYRRRALDAGLRVGKNHACVVEHVGRATMGTVYPNGEDFAIGRENYIKKWGEVD